MLCDAFCSHTALPRARGMHQPRDSAVFSLKTNNNSNSDEQNGLITLDYVSLKGSKQTEKRKQATRSKWLLRQEAVWCRDSTGWFLPVMSHKKRHMLPLFSGLTIFLAFAVHWRSWRGPRPAWLCGSFSGWLKPGSQSLTHIPFGFGYTPGRGLRFW